MMKTSTNKEAYRIWKNYENSYIHSVRDAYKTRCSDAKQFAEIAIMSEMNALNGFCYRIISANGFTFTCGYMMNTDAGTMLVYHSKSRRLEILIDNE